MLNDGQCGLRKCRSYISALLNIYDSTLNYILEDKATCVDRVYFDHVEAFDTTDSRDQ